MPLRANVSSIPAPDPLDISPSEASLYERFLLGMEKLGPFEERPHVAVGVSGGSDSMALVRLVQRWARSRQGRVVALTVDHGLRSGSRQEAEAVGDWLSALGVDQHILTWQGKKRATRIQAAARDARYRLMEEWCAANHVLHLCVGHTSNDQAETYLMRESHGSGKDGLAGMSLIRESRKCRLLRPLLAMKRDELRHFLRMQEADWVEDPSNKNAAFERVRCRMHLAMSKPSETDLCIKASGFAKARMVGDRALAQQLAKAVSLHPLGTAAISHDVFAQADSEMQAKVLSRVLSVIGGRAYAPSLRRMGALLSQISEAEFPTMTMGGCQISWTKTGVSIIREQRGLPHPLSVKPGDCVHWDNRFQMVFGEGLLRCRGAATLRSLEDRDWPMIKAKADLRQWPLSPYQICRSLPVIMDDEGVFAMPHVGYLRDEKKKNQNNASESIRFLSFYPQYSLSGAGFAVA